MMEVLDGEVVWTPNRDRVTRSPLTAFALAHRGHGVADRSDYDDLWAWSTSRPSEFWSAIATDAGVTWHTRPATAAPDDGMPGAMWFRGGTLNYVDLALARRGPQPAVEFVDEAGDTRSVSRDELADEVRRAAAGLRRLGVGRGDRVAAYAPNRVETLIAFLATASLGAVWTATSPDFGEDSVLDRFQQVEPTVLLAVSGYRYNGHWHDRRGVVERLRGGLPSLSAVVAMPCDDPITDSTSWSELTAPADEPLVPEPVPFDHPLWIVYTSGTTGKPKSIVHGHGGVLLEHHKLLRLHLDLVEGDRFFWFSTTGWVMWNIVIGGLLVGATVVLYDGSPTHPGPDRLWELAAETNATFLGLSAGFVQAAMRDGHEPTTGRDLGAVRSVGVTGSPLPAAGYRWLLDHVDDEIFIASISGGTDIATAFIGSVPTLPVRAGMLQARCLGVDATAFDAAGKEVVGDTGELVVRSPMPSMPVSFWNDVGYERYRSSYFDEYPGIWRHGDWVRVETDGSCVVLGRSDATLNRGGVRMGSGDFYGVIDRIGDIADSVIIDTTSVESPSGRLVLVVQLSDDAPAVEVVVDNVRSQLRAALSPRHVPDDVVVVDRLPRTLNGKRLEVPTKRLFLGVAPETAADPSAVDDAGALAALAEAAADWRRRSVPE